MLLRGPRHQWIPDPPLGEAGVGSVASTSGSPGVQGATEGGDGAGPSWVRSRPSGAAADGNCRLGQARPGPARPVRSSSGSHSRQRANARHMHLAGPSTVESPGWRPGRIWRPIIRAWQRGEHPSATDLQPPGATCRNNVPTSRVAKPRRLCGTTFKGKQGRSLSTAAAFRSFLSLPFPFISFSFLIIFFSFTASETESSRGDSRTNVAAVRTAASAARVSPTLGSQRRLTSPSRHRLRRPLPRASLLCSSCHLLSVVWLFQTSKVQKN